MRETKFRGRNYGKWFYGSLFVDTRLDLISCEIIYFDNDGHSFQVNVAPESVGQYTGLKDKNGKEIYEGDIVVTFGIDDENYRSAVLWEDGAFGYNSGTRFGDFISFESNSFFQWRDGKSEDIEVIGNIYENPELLKGASINE